MRTSTKRSRTSTKKQQTLPIRRRTYNSPIQRRNSYNVFAGTNDDPIEVDEALIITTTRDSTGSSYKVSFSFANSMVHQLKLTPAFFAQVFTLTLIKEGFAWHHDGDIVTNTDEGRTEINLIFRSTSYLNEKTDDTVWLNKIFGHTPHRSEMFTAVNGDIIHVHEFDEYTMYMYSYKYYHPTGA